MMDQRYDEAGGCHPEENPWATADDAVEEVRAIRRRISAQFDHDPLRLAEFYMKLQERHADRLVDPPPRKKGRSAA